MALNENIFLLIENRRGKTGETTGENGSLGGDPPLFGVIALTKTDRCPKLNKPRTGDRWFPQRVRSSESFFAVPFFFKSGQEGRNPPD